MAFKLVVLGLVALSCFGNVNGLKCYECGDVDSDLLKIPSEETCKHELSKEHTVDCPSSKPHCFKGTGTVKDGKYIELRSCVDHEFKKHTVGDSDKGCKSVKEINNFKFNVGSNQYAPESGEVCVCDTDKCNPATNVYPVYTFIIAGGVLSLIFGL